MSNLHDTFRRELVSGPLPKWIDCIRMADASEALLKTAVVRLACGAEINLKLFASKGQKRIYTMEHYPESESVVTLVIRRHEYPKMRNMTLSVLGRENKRYSEQGTP